MEFLKQFPYVIKYKKGKNNIVVNALSRRHILFPKFLDLITYLNFMLKILNSLIFLLIASTRRMEVFMNLRVFF